jgi:hypothetical protein
MCEDLDTWCIGGESGFSADMPCVRKDQRYRASMPMIKLDLLLVHWVQD